MPKYNPQDKPLYIIVFAVALVVLLMLYSGDMNASDTRVICFSEKQVEEIQQDIVNNVEDAFEAGHTQGMMDALDVMSRQIADHCATAKPEDAYIRMPDGLVLACPAK